MNKNLTLGLLVAILFLQLISTIGTCNNGNKLTANKKEINQLNAKVDSNQKNTQIMMELEGYKISKRMLYDNNSIIRTKERPDDVMAEYDKSIDGLQKKLKQ